MAQGRGNLGGSWRLLLAAVALAGLLAASYALPVEDWALWLAEWIRDAGALGVAVFVLAYVVGAALLLPGSLLTLIAGFAYGPVLGTLVVWPASTLAATVAFLLGRFVARDWVRRRVEGRPRFAAIDRSVGESGFKIVVLLRLSPVFPFSLLNYALGLTRIKLPHYVLASLVGMLPGVALYVYLGSLITRAAALAEGAPDAGPAKWALYAVGLLATAAVTIVLTRIAKRALNRKLEPEAGADEPGAEEAPHEAAAEGSAN